MDGLIKIENYPIKCKIGAYPGEQEMFLDINMRANFATCVQTDRIADTVDYELVEKVCKNLVQSREYHLLETLAYELLHALLEELPIALVNLRVKKPLNATTIIVELEKEI